MVAWRTAEVDRDRLMILRGVAIFARFATPTNSRRHFLVRFQMGSDKKWFRRVQSTNLSLQSTVHTNTIQTPMLCPNAEYTE